MRFLDAMPMLLEFEGGYVNDPRDPGGETKYGISKRAYPKEDIKDMTLERAYEIYRRDYWEPILADQLPPRLRFPLFDTAVNCGVKQAVKLLQKTVGTTQDGVLGPKTLQAVWGMEQNKLAANFLGNRLQFLTSLNTFNTFGRGWAKRVADNLLTI
jgi:lysozyme family protein